MSRIRRTTSLSMSMPKARAICSAIRGQPPGRIPPFHLNDGGDELLAGSFRAGLTSALWGKQQPVLSLDENVMEMQQSRRLQNDGRTQKTARPQPERAQTGDDPVEDMQVGSAFPASIKD